VQVGRGGQQVEELFAAFLVQHLAGVGQWR
jgi:hypothetical protein